jgi:hypothetical protein
MKKIERGFEGSGVGILEVLARKLLAWKTTINLIHDSRCPNRNSNPAPPEYCYA